MVHNFIVPDMVQTKNLQTASITSRLQWLLYSTQILLRKNCLNPFPNKPWILHVCRTSILKTLWEKVKLLVILSSLLPIQEQKKYDVKNIDKWGYNNLIQ